MDINVEPNLIEDLAKSTVIKDKIEGDRVYTLQLISGLAAGTFRHNSVYSILSNLKFNFIDRYHVIEALENIYDIKIAPCVMPEEILYNGHILTHEIEQDLYNIGWIQIHN